MAERFINIARIAKAASHKLTGKSSLNVSFVLSSPVLEVQVRVSLFSKFQLLHKIKQILCTHEVQECIRHLI